MGGFPVSEKLALNFYKLSSYHHTSLCIKCLLLSLDLKFHNPKGSMVTSYDKLKTQQKLRKHKNKLKMIINYKIQYSKKLKSKTQIYKIISKTNQHLLYNYIYILKVIVSCPKNLENQTLILKNIKTIITARGPYYVVYKLRIVDYLMRKCNYNNLLLIFLFLFPIL